MICSFYSMGARYGRYKPGCHRCFKSFTEWNEYNWSTFSEEWAIDINSAARDRGPGLNYPGGEMISDPVLLS